jgi:hypothetical protein
MRRSLVSLLLMTVGVVGCGKGDSAGSGIGSRIGSLLRDKTGATAPKFTPSLSTVALRTGLVAELAPPSWGPGNAVYDLFLLMREFQSPRDEGKIDMTNFYKVLFETSRYGDSYADQCASSPIAEKVIPAPYPAFAASYPYKCAGNDTTSQPGYAHGWAFNDAGDVKSMLIGFMWGGNAGGGSLGVIQGRYDATAESLKVDMVSCTNCGVGTNSFTVRMFIEGNPANHTFSLRTVTWPWNGSSGYRSINGQGVSQGDGQHFLFRIQTDVATPVYYCFPASATEDQLKLVDPAGTEAPAAECADYGAGVEAMPFWTDADVPKAETDFTGSSILLSF